MIFAKTVRLPDEHKLLMAFWSQFHPKYVRQAWQTLDEEAAAERTNPAAANFRAAVGLITAAFCLLLIHYLKFRLPT